MTRKQRATTATTLILGTLFATACDRSPAKEEETARAEQRKADDKAAEYQATANQKAGEDQAKANEAARDAVRTLDATKADLKQSAQKDLDDASRKVDDLRAKSAKATGTARLNLDAALADVDNKRSTVESQIRALDEATADQVNKAKERLDQQIAQLKQSIDQASKKI